MSLIEFLNGLIAELDAKDRRSDDRLFWTTLNGHLRDHQLADPPALEQRLSAELSAAAGSASPFCLGPCWELLDRWIEFLEEHGRPTEKERAVHQVFDRLLDRVEGIAPVLQQLGEWDTAAGRAPYRVRLTVEPVGCPGGGLRADAPFRLRLDVPEEECEEWLAVTVLHGAPDGRWTPLFPNRWDHVVPWLVPGVDMLIPEAGACYELRTPRDPGPFRLKAIVTPRAIPFPVDYVRGVTRWTGKGPPEKTPWKEFLERRKSAVSELCDLIRDTPGSADPPANPFRPCSNPAAGRPASSPSPWPAIPATARPGGASRHTAAGSRSAGGPR